MNLSQRIEFRNRRCIRSTNKGLEGRLNALYFPALIIKPRHGSLGVLGEVGFQRGKASSFLIDKCGELIKLRDVGFRAQSEDVAAIADLWRQEIRSSQHHIEESALKADFQG